VLYVGRDDFGHDRYLSLRGLTGIFVSGLPGYGKTSLIASWLCQLTTTPAAQFALLDGKDGGDQAPWHDRAWRHCGDQLADALDVLEDALPPPSRRSSRCSGQCLRQLSRTALSRSIRLRGSGCRKSRRVYSCRWVRCRSWRSPRQSVRATGSAWRWVRVRASDSARRPASRFSEQSCYDARLEILEQAQNGALAPLKTKASRRTIPVGNWVTEEIAAHLQRFGPGYSQVIMSNNARRIIRRSAFGYVWRSAVAAARTCGKPPAGASAAPECGDTCAEPAHMLPAGTRFHDLRHFYASALIAANLNPKVIQTRLGHATIAETMDTYGHLFPDAEELGRTAVDQALGVELAEPDRNRRTG
jgi:hypothetical protein